MWYNSIRKEVKEMTKDEKRQIQAMRELGFSDEEIADVLESDKRIDKGEKLFELNADQKQAEKKMRQADRKPTVYDFSKRERKANDSKRAIIAALAETARELADSGEVDITNIEREMLFVANGVKYKIVLSAPRS
jgi:DNA-binding transcriptional MerR regulator